MAGSGGLAESKYGKLDILVNHAGILIPGATDEYSEDDWKRTMAVNLRGVFLGIKHAIPAMRRAGGGSIVNISSGAGITPPPGTSGAYAVSKGRVRPFTKSVAIQHAQDKIRCNSVYPGLIDTLMIRGPHRDGVWVDSLVGRVPLGHMGTAEDIAYGVLYLALDESSFVTGSELVIDGG